MDAFRLATKADVAGTAASTDAFRAPLVDFSRLELQLELFESEIQKWMCVGLSLRATAGRAGGVASPPSSPRPAAWSRP